MRSTVYAETKHKARSQLQMREAKIARVSLLRGVHERLSKALGATVRHTKFPGLRSNHNRRGKYDGCKRVKVEGVMVRKLTRTEIREWRERLNRIMNPGYVVVEVKTRRAVV